jgi:hypothetical protein
MYFIPNSKKCAEDYGEGPDACDCGADTQDSESLEDAIN